MQTIQQILRQLLNESAGNILCTVDSVEGMKCNCTPVNGTAPILNVRLTASINNESKFVLVPREGSFVIVSFYDNDFPFVAMVNEVSQVLYKNGDTVFRVDDKFLLSSGSENLLSVMLDLIQAMIDERHMTNSGATISLTPASVLKYEAIKNRFNTLLKDN